LGRGGGRRARAGLAEGDCVVRPATCQREPEHAQREHPGYCEPSLHCCFPSTRVHEFPALNSRRKASAVPFVSPGTKFGAKDEKASMWSSLLKAMPLTALESAPCWPAGPTLAMVVVPARRSRTKTSMMSVALSSPGTRLEASELKAT